MASPWEKQFKAFLKRAGTELRRTGDEVKGEAQRLIEEMRDPERQARVREQIEDLRGWAKKASKDLVDAVENVVSKVEGVITQDSGAKTQASATSKAERPATAPKGESKPKAAKKTVGRASGQRGKKTPSAPKPAGAKKTVGRKPAAKKSAAAGENAAPKAARKAPKAKAPRPPKAGSTPRKTGGRGQ